MMMIDIIDMPEVGCVVGRKRTSKKEKISISVDKDIIEELRELKVDRSLLFTKAAKDHIEKVSGEKKSVRKGLDLF